MIGGNLVTEGVVDSIVESVCQLWLDMQRQVACCKGVVIWTVQLLQHHTLQYHKVNVRL